MFIQSIVTGAHSVEAVARSLVHFTPSRIRTLFWVKLCATGSVGKVPHGYLFGDESGEMDQASVLPKNEEAGGEAKGTRESHPGKESEGEQVGVYVCIVLGGEHQEYVYLVGKVFLIVANINMRPINVREAEA